MHVVDLNKTWVLIRFQCLAIHFVLTRWGTLIRMASQIHCRQQEVYVEVSVKIGLERI